MYYGDKLLANEAKLVKVLAWFRIKSGPITGMNNFTS